MQRIERSRLKGPINAEAVGSPVEDEWKLQINRFDAREQHFPPLKSIVGVKRYIQLDVK